MSRNAGAKRAKSCSPASVNATLRVVRLTSRRSRRSSNARSLWLSADGVTPSSSAARRKLLCRAIAKKVARSDGLTFGIDELCSLLRRKSSRLYHQRSEERRVGKESISTCRYRVAPYH